MTYNDTLNYLYHIENLGIRPGLSRILSVLSRLEFPHKTYPSILIAGTNGKGSTTEILSSILIKAGYKTGIFTSPHIFIFEERIRINNFQIPPEKVVEYTNIIKSHLKTNEYLTFFEFVSVIAFLYFAEQQIDIGVFEVGMGGRLDATNVLNPIVSIISSIDLDHTDWLGDTIEKIAYEKAGIIKKNKLTVSSCINPGAIKVIEDVGKIKGSKILLINRDFSVKITPITKKSFNSRNLNYQSFDFFDRKTQIKNLTLPLLGEHFIINASAAIKTSLYLKEKGYEITEDNIHKGLKSVKLPCRAEIVGYAPNIIIDVAHNLKGVEVLFNTIKSHFQYKKLFIVFGIMQDKVNPRIFNTLSQYAYKIFLTKPEAKRSAEPKNIIKENISISYKCIIIESVKNGVLEALKTASREDIIVITGSFYTAAEAKKVLLERL